MGSWDFTENYSNEWREDQTQDRNQGWKLRGVGGDDRPFSAQGELCCKSGPASMF